MIVGLLSSVAAQNNNPDSTSNDSIKSPIYRGFIVEVDVAPLIESALINRYAYSFQGNLMVNLNNRFFPIVEIGYAGANKANILGAQFNTSGLFEKVGIDLRLMKPKPKATIKNNFLLGGLRLGMSHFNYSIKNILMEDDYWGGSEIINAENISTTKLWFEFVAGIRASVYNDIYMGWNVRNKRLISRTKPGENAPWYIPGYGLGNTSAWGFSYVIGYKF